MHYFLSRSISIAALIAATSGVLAQTTAVPAAADPAVGGQASTKTPSGVPNPTQRPDGSTPITREGVRSEARMENKNNTNTMTPKGEASTMTNGKPNAPQAVGAMSRTDVKPTSRELKPQAGKMGERPDVPTNPTAETGTPK